MKRIIIGVVSAALMVAAAGPVSAKNSKKHHEQYDSYAAKYPSATRRQLKNARAYDNGEYYEMDSNAHPVGSRGWWELKERERGGLDFR